MSSKPKRKKENWFCLLLSPPQPGLHSFWNSNPWIEQPIKANGCFPHHFVVVVVFQKNCISFASDNAWHILGWPRQGRTFLLSLNGAKSGFPQTAGWFKNRRKWFSFSKQVLPLCLFGIVVFINALVGFILSSSSRLGKKIILSEVPLSIAASLRKALGENAARKRRLWASVSAFIYLFTEMVAPPTPQFSRRVYLFISLLV